jgi:hypothetical protein
MLLPCLFFGLLPACGSGGGEGGDGEAVMTGFLLRNNTLTFGGQTNTHAIVGYSFQRSGASEASHSPPVLLAPGDSRFQPLPVGSYTLVATFDDGHTESLQVPPDRVDAYADEVRTVNFLY